MKRLFAILLASMLSVTAFAQKVSSKYIPDKSKPVLLVFTADWCAPCEAMKQNVFTVDSVAAAMSRYNVLMVDVDTPVGAAYQERFCKREVQIPYFVVLDRSGFVRARKLGAMQAGPFLSFLRESGTLDSSTPVTGAVKYVDVPDRSFKKGWEFEAAVGGALSSSSDTTARRLGVALALDARYRASRMVAIRPGLEAVITPSAPKYIPSFTLRVPVDLEVYLLESAYLSGGIFWAMHNTAIKGMRADAGIRAGLGYRFRDFDVRFIYNLGVLNLNKGEIVNRVTTDGAMVTVGYCF